MNRIIIGVYRLGKSGRTLRITMPSEVAERMGLKEGDKLIYFWDDDAKELIIKRR